MRSLFALTSFAAVVVLAAPAIATSHEAAAAEQPEAAEPAVPEAEAAKPAPPEPAADQPAPPKTKPSGGAAGDGKPYVSKDREKCEDELRKDDAWRAKLKGQLRLEVHEEESSLITRNNKHVVLAYAALWLIVVIFVVQMWRKQRGLREEIERLQREVRDAAAE